MSGTPEVMYAVRRKDGDPICDDFTFVVVPDPHDWAPAEDDAEYRLDADTYELVRMTVEVVATRLLPECGEYDCSAPATYWGLCGPHAREDDPEHFDPPT